MDIVIVGSGPAGFHAALQCRLSWPKKSVALIEGEARPGCCRPLLPQFMAGQAEEERLFLFKPREDPLLTVKSGARVRSLDRGGRTVLLENGETVPFERLILAPGGRPIVPRLDGAQALEGVFPVRNLPEAQRTRSWISKDRQIFVLGGGLVGVKTARYLRTAGFRVAVVEKEETLLPQALTAEAAGLVEEHLRRLGVEVHLGRTLEAVEGEGGRIQSVRIAGSAHACGALLLAVGSVPEVSFLEGSGLLDQGKLLVSAALQTRDPGIFAAGDAVFIAAADGRRHTPWTWPQAVSQGKLAAANLYRPAPVPLRSLTRVNSMNLEGLALGMLGAFAGGEEKLSYSPPGGGALRQVFLRQGRIAGGALVGEVSGAGALHHLMAAEKDSGGEMTERLKPSWRVLPRSLSEKGARRRRARLTFGEEKTPC